jgi:hypothetical protein
MAFANEYLTDEEERKKYGKAHVTLDRDRDAWLSRTGGAGRTDEFPEFFQLQWKNEIIKMHVYESRTRIVGDRLNIKWEVAKMQVPEKLEICRPEIISMIGEAFSAYKCGGNARYDHLVKEVIVEISEKIINYKVGDPTWM